jgi:hypothetical protein
MMSPTGKLGLAIAAQELEIVRHVMTAVLWRGVLHPAVVIGADGRMLAGHQARDTIGVQETSRVKDLQEFASIVLCQTGWQTRAA